MRSQRSVVPVLVVLMLGAATLGLILFFVGLGRLREWLDDAQERATAGLMAQEALEPAKEAAVDEAVRQARGEPLLGPRPVD